MAKSSEQCTAGKFFMIYILQSESQNVVQLEQIEKGYFNPAMITTVAPVNEYDVYFPKERNLGNV